MWRGLGRLSDIALGATLQVNDVCTLGVLFEVETHLERPLHEVFDLIYGTSTGSIIGSMLALGETVDTITSRYLVS